MAAKRRAAEVTDKTNVNSLLILLTRPTERVTLTDNFDGTSLSMVAKNWRTEANLAVVIIIDWYCNKCSTGIEIVGYPGRWGSAKQVLFMSIAIQWALMPTAMLRRQCDDSMNVHV